MATQTINGEIECRIALICTSSARIIAAQIVRMNRGYTLKIPRRQLM